MAKRKRLCITKPQFVRLVKRYVLEDVPSLDKIEFIPATAKQEKNESRPARLTWKGVGYDHYSVYLRRDRGVNKLIVNEYFTTAVLELPTRSVYEISDDELFRLHLLKEVA